MTIIFHIVMSSCNTNVKTEVVSKQSWYFVTSTSYEKTNPKIFQTDNYCKKRKRNVIPDINKHLKSFKRKHIGTQETTCTPFFILRTTVKKQVPSSKYQIPPYTSESLLCTDVSLPIDSVETKRGKLHNFFFPKMSLTTVSQKLEFSSNTSSNESTRSVTVVSCDLNEDSTKNLTTEKNLSALETRDNFQPAVNKIAETHETSGNQTSTTKMTAVPSMKFDLGLSSGDHKDFVKTPTKLVSVKTLSSPFSKPNLKSEFQSENPVTTVNFLQKFKLKMLTFNSLKETTNTINLKSTTKTTTVSKKESNNYLTDQMTQSSNERSPDYSVPGTTDSTTFYPYTKFQVKDLFNFKERPTSEQSHVDPTPFMTIKETLENLTSTSVFTKASTISAFNNHRDKSVWAKQISENCKPLKITTESGEEEEYQSINDNNTPCECSLDYGVLTNKSNFNVKIDTPELDFIETWSTEVKNVTSHNFVNFKNLFSQNKQKTNPNSSRKELSCTKYLDESLHNSSHLYTLPNKADIGLMSSEKNATLFPNVNREEHKLLDSFSSKKSLTVTNSNSGLKQVWFTSIPSTSSRKNLPSKKPLSWVKYKPNTLTTWKDTLKMSSVFNLQNDSEKSKNLNYNDSEEEFNSTEFPISLSANSESKVHQSSNANHSLVDMNPEEFYHEFEKNTETMLNNKSMLFKKHKLNFKHVFDFMKQKLTSQIKNLPLKFSEQIDFNDSFQTEPMKMDSSKNFGVEVEEGYGNYTSTRRSNLMKFRFNLNTPLTTSTQNTFQGKNREDSDEELQRSSPRLSARYTVPAVFLSADEETSTINKGNTLYQQTFNYTEVPPLADGIAKKVFKLKSVLCLHKPVSSNNSKLCKIFDPGGMMSSDILILHSVQTVKIKPSNSFEKRVSSSTQEYSTVTEQYHFKETESIDYSTKPAGWWLFWNQPKVTVDNLLNSKNSPNRFVVTKPSNLFRGHSMPLSICQNTTKNPLSFSNSTSSSLGTTQSYLKNTEGKGAGSSNLKNIRKYILGYRKSLRTSIPAQLNSYGSEPSADALNKKRVIHKKVNISISNLNVNEAKSKHNTLHNCSNKNIHSSVNVVSLNKNIKMYKPFQSVLSTTKPLGLENVSEYQDTKNFSYFIQNLTHSSNNALKDNFKQINLNSNITKENFKLDLLNKTVINTNDKMTSVNDSSFNIMAYVLRPFESLISVFKGKSTENMTKVGDVNASDIHNGSIPSHLHPQNSSLIILALNDSNSTSKEVHESKVGLFDVLGGWFHCIVETYVEPSPRDIHFYLFTRNNIDTPEELFLSEEEVELKREENATDIPTPVWEIESSSESDGKKRQTDDESNSFEPLNFATSELESKWFNLLAETKILIHGYIQDYQTDIIVNMKDAYLKKGAFNVIVVDWSTVGDNTCYPSVAEHGLYSVGRLLSRLLDQLVAGGVSLAKIHIVGFSLGAHVAGIAGTNTRGLLSRITGLDPALPYVPMDPEICLDAGDAVFVDIIHSAAGYLGQPGPTGHVDFYPNGGSQQPGCDLASLGACSHRRSALYFIESIASDIGFKATPCDNWHDFLTGRCNSSAGVDLLMGDPCPANASGKYFLRTGHKEPFALLAEEHSKVKKSLLLDIFYELV